MRRVRCPTCREPVMLVPSNPWRPFCSERCKLLDLAAWADERYRIPGEAVPTSAVGPGGDDDAGAPPRH